MSTVSFHDPNSTTSWEDPVSQMDHTPDHDEGDKLQEQDPNDEYGWGSLCIGSCRVEKVVNPNGIHRVYDVHES